VRVCVQIAWESEKKTENANGNGNGNGNGVDAGGKQSEGAKP